MKANIIVLAIVDAVIVGVAVHFGHLDVAAGWATSSICIRMGAPVWAQ